MSNSDKLIPFTEEERKGLAGQKLRALISVIIFALVTLGILILAFILFLNFAILYGALAAIFGLVAAGRTLSSLSGFLTLKRDLSEGQKRIIIAPVEAQDIKVSRQNRRIQGVNVEGPASYNYWVGVQGLEVSVTEEQYYQYKKGDLAEVHVAPHSKTILRDIAKITDKSVA